MAAPERAPVLFVGHGAPTLAIDRDKGAPLQAWGAGLARPRAVLVLSAHWETGPPTLGTTRTRPLIHDYAGFPPALRQVTYPAPGAPELAARVRDLLGEDLAQAPERGWDHGVWTPLVHLLPEADVPLLQLSLPRDRGAAALPELGRRLAPLRDEGVWLLGSGSLTHDLGGRLPDGEAPPPETADFDAWVAARLEAGDHQALVEAPTRRRDFRHHHPTPEHWDVMLPLLGAVAPGEPVTFPVEGFEFGVLSRRAVQWGGADPGA